VGDFAGLSGDKALAEARIRLETALTGVTAQMLRDSPEKRNTVREEATRILESFNF
jgi:hypothetical protein